MTAQPNAPSAQESALPPLAPAEGFHAGIAGLGMCVPDRILTNEDLTKIVDTTDEWITKRTGIRERRLSDPDTATSDLATRAAERALADAGIAAADLDLVLCATATGDYLWPATACIIQNRLGATRAAAFDLSAACSGFCYGLATAAGFIQSGAMRRVLVIGADTLSKQINWEDRSTCILFGDGAAAAVLTPCAADEGIITSVLGADGSEVESVWMPAGGTRTPLTEAERVLKLNTIHMKGREVYEFVMKVVPDVIEEALHRACLRTEDIDLLVLHQANLRIIEGVGKRLKLSDDRLFVNVDRYGNTSAASIPIALTEAAQQGRIKRGDVVVTVGFGAGLTWAANVIRWNRDEVQR